MTRPRPAAATIQTLEPRRLLTAAAMAALDQIDSPFVHEFVIDDAGNVSHAPHGDEIGDSHGEDFDFYAPVPGLKQGKDFNPVAVGGAELGDFDIVVDLDLNGLGGSTAAAILSSFAQAEARWEKIILGDLQNYNYFGFQIDDLFISADVGAIDGFGGILGSAGPQVFRPSGDATPFLPLIGQMNFDSADVGSLLNDRGGEGFTEVVVHEMGHVLGIGPLWGNFGLRTGGSDIQYTGANAIAAYNAVRNSDAATVPIETGGGGGTAGSHWRETTLRTELMTGFLNGGTQNALSRITAGSIVDLGYLDVDLDGAEAYELPSNTDAGSSNRNRAPSVGSLAAAASGGQVTLTASNVTDPTQDNNALDRVEFWYESNGRPGLQRGTSSPDSFVAQDFGTGPTFSTAVSAASLPGGEVTFYARAYDARGLNSGDAVDLFDVSADTVAPVVQSTFFEAIDRQAITITFSEPVQDVQASDLFVVNLNTFASLDPAGFDVQVFNGGAGVTFEWDVAAFGPLPNGNYSATLDAGTVEDAAGNPLASAATVTFFALNGDVNRNRTVNTQDLLVVLNNFGTTGQNLTGGDVNYNGTVNTQDLLVVLNAFGTSLPSNVVGGSSLFAGDGDGDDDGTGDLLA